MNNRFKFRIAVYERQQNNMPWEFVEYIDPDNQHWGLNQCGDIISDSSYSAHYTRKNAPDSVHRVYEPEMSTGLKDKNGKLIYEGDIVIGRKEIVVCELKEYKDVVEYKDGEYFPFNCTGVYNPEKFEIIGNIHEQTEQRGAK